MYSTINHLLYDLQLDSRARFVRPWKSLYSMEFNWLKFKVLKTWNFLNGIGKEFEVFNNYNYTFSSLFDRKYTEKIMSILLGDPPQKGLICATYKLSDTDGPVNRPAEHTN